MAGDAHGAHAQWRWHLYYRVEGEVRNSVGKLAQGVDVRGQNGYVVAPPSPGWEWANNLPMATIDASVLRGDDGRDQRPRERRAHRGRKLGQPSFRLQERIDDGERNSMLASFAGWLHWSGYAPQDIEELLLACNDERCHPPLKDADVRRVAHSITRYER